jgi:hypothetical protein
MPIFIFEHLEQKLEMPPQKKQNVILFFFFFSKKRYHFRDFGFVVVCVLAPCTVMTGYQRFVRPFCLHL